MKDDACFVYFIGYDDFVKIGHTTNLEKRLVSLQCANPNKLELFLVIYYDSKRKAVKDERRLHTSYKKNRIRGEWFRGIDLTNEWPKIHALTYVAKKYEAHIETNDDGRICNNVFPVAPHEIEIPKQEIPFSDAKSSRNSSEVIYHLLFVDPELRTGTTQKINDKLDFPVSVLTIKKARLRFKKYTNKKMPDKCVSLMLYIIRNPRVSRKLLSQRFGATYTEVATAKEYAKLHKVAQKYEQNYTYE